LGGGCFTQCANQSTPTPFFPEPPTQRPTGQIRGNYRCRRCGGMKKNHNCPMLYDSVEKQDMGTEVRRTVLRGGGGVIWVVAYKQLA
jgi:hypothetical protein